MITIPALSKAGSKWAIFDMDNCLSDDRARIPKINWQKTGDERYHVYHSLASFDSLFAPAFFKLRGHQDQGHKIAIFTAQPCAYAEARHEWLRRNGIIPDHIAFRNNGDHRPSAEIKRSMLDDFITMSAGPGDTILCAYDDHDEILAMYRERGINAIKLACHSLNAYSPPGQTADRGAAHTYETPRELPANRMKRMLMRVETSPGVAPRRAPPVLLGESGPEIGRFVGSVVNTDGSISVEMNISSDFAKEFIDSFTHRPDRPLSMGFSDLDTTNGTVSESLETSEGEAMPLCSDPACEHAIHHHAHLPPRRVIDPNGGLNEFVRASELIGSGFVDAPEESDGVPYIMQQAQRTFAERNAAYGDNYKRFGPVLLSMFQDGTLPYIDTPEAANRLQLFIQLLNKLMRYAEAMDQGGHCDSARDMQVYAAMLEDATK